jgi:hypothetical protein
MLKSLLSIIVILVPVIFLKLDSRFVFIISLLTIFLSGLAMLTKHFGVANSLLDYTFWLLFLGFVRLMWENIKHKNE